MVEYYNILIHKKFLNNKTSLFRSKFYFVLFCLLCSYIHAPKKHYLSSIERNLPYKIETQYYRDGMKISLLYSDDLFQLSSINHWTYRRAYVVLSINCLQSSLLQQFIFFVTFFFISLRKYFLNWWNFTMMVI